MSQPRVVSTVSELREQIAAWRRSGETIGLAPTMGALHAGHLALVRLSQTIASKTIVSIFVNPLQFAPDEDLAAYPRRLEDDLARLTDVAADLVFYPQPSEIFPPGFATSIHIGGPALAGLEDKFRPTHFIGVATIVAKLLLICAPHAAIFGEKDFQQLAVVRRLVRDLDIDVQLAPAPIIRETDGLAMSSRNVYLSAEERPRAARLFATLRQTAESITNGTPIPAALREGVLAIESAGFSLDYLELRESDTLAPVDLLDKEGRLLVAARLGRTRLIDNVAATAPERDGKSR